MANKKGNRIKTEIDQINHKIKKVKVSKIIFLAIALVLVIWISNPALIPFLPQGARESIGDVWTNLFGDVDSAMEILVINWGTVFKLIAMVLLLLLVNTIGQFILQRIQPKTGKGKSGLSLAQSAMSWLLVLIGIFWGLSIFGISMGTVLASVGVLALIIGFGAESLVADVVTGIFLVFENQFNVDDIIEIENFRGTVEAIGVRTTSIRDIGGNVKIVNNSDIRNVLNRSTANSKAVTEVGISYRADLEQVEEILKGILPTIREKYPDVFLSDPIYLGVQELSTSSVILKFVADVREQDVFTAPRLMNREIKIGFDKSGVEIPFTQIVVHNAEQ